MVDGQMDAAEQAFREEALERPERALSGPVVVFVTGRAGAGRSTAMNALEDLGFPTVDTPPLALIPAIVEQHRVDGQATNDVSEAAGDAMEGGRQRVLAIGLDCRAFPRDARHAAEAFDTIRGGLQARGSATFTIFLTASEEALRRRYTETRRRHPLAPTGAVEDGLACDAARTAELRALADVVIDTSAMRPADLKQDIQARCGHPGGAGLALSLVSFSYRQGLPAEADLVFDCRFLRNPYYELALRGRDGRDPAVAAFVAEDPRYATFVARLLGLLEFLLPAYRAEGKSYLTVAFGCTGGKHRSVAVAEAVAAALRAQGWSPAVRHRERAEQEQPTGDAGARDGESGASDAA